MDDVNLMTLKDAMKAVGTRIDAAKGAYERQSDEQYLVGIRCFDDFYPIAYADDAPSAIQLICEYDEVVANDKKSYVPKYFAFDEILTLIDATARPYCDSTKNGWIVGIEMIAGIFPMQTFQDAGDADAYVAELDKALNEHLGDVPTIDEETTNILAGFDFVPSKGVPTILIGRRNRLYFKGGVEKVIGLHPKSRVVIGYSDAEDAFAVALPSAVSREAQAAGYYLSNRKDVTCAKLFSAKRFNERFKLGEDDEVSESERTYYMDKTLSDAKVAIFKRY